MPQVAAFAQFSVDEEPQANERPANDI